jgi:hypothetical protein
MAPQLPGRPVFYPVLKQDYPAKIARDWNVRHSGSGYVTMTSLRTMNDTPTPSPR